MNGTMEIDVKQSSPREVKMDGEEIRISINCQENSFSTGNTYIQEGLEMHSSTGNSETMHYSDIDERDVLQHDRKPVKLCDFYKRSGKCRFGEKCFFSHDMRKKSHDPIINTKQPFDFNSNRNDRNPPLPSVNASKERSASRDWRKECDEENQGNSYLNINSTNRKPCRFFVDKMGCKFGDQCSFTHYRSVGDAGEDAVEVFNSSDVSTRESQSSRYKHDIMKDEDQQQDCENEPHETPKKASKTRCRFLLKNGHCRKGNNCEFSHLLKGQSKEKLNEVNTVSNFDNADGNIHEPANSKLKDTPSDVIKDTKKTKTCYFFLRGKGCRLNDKCPYLHKTVETVKSKKENSNEKKNITDECSEKEIPIEPAKGNVKCQFYFSDSGGGCRFGKNCSYLHDNSPLCDNSSNTKSNVLVDKVLDKSENCSDENSSDAARTSNQNCTFFSSPKGCFKGNNCHYLHISEEKGVNNCSKDYLVLQETEYKQLEKRFSAGKKFLLVESTPSRIYLVTFEPTDPDWGIVVKEFVLQVEFPADYPKTLFTIALQENEVYPEGFTGFMNAGIQGWLDGRQLERDEHDLAFRDFLRWFDKNAESLVLNAGRKVKQLRDCQEAGITLIPHDQILHTNPAATDDHPTSPGDDERLYEPTTSPTTAPTTLPSPGDEEGSSEAVNAMMAPQDSTISSDSKVKLSSKVRIGTEIKFSHLEVNENVASIILKNILLIAQCSRCKSRSEFNLQQGKKSTLACKKCRVNHCATYHPEIVHQHSHVAGYLHLEGCRAFDLVLIDSLVLLNCLNCSKDNTKKGIAYGKKGDYWCEFCHTKMEIHVQCTKFNQLQNNGEKVQIVKTAPAKKAVKYPGVKEGTPLPDNGTCKHYRKSYRWLRFPCCGKLYACDICHEEGEENDHDMKFATRMICGYCSKEQPFFKDKACVGCNANVTKSRSAHWEGGKGCRNRSSMSRGDNKKTAGLGKTISRKKADDH